MKKKNTQEISKVRVCVCVVSLVHKRNTQKKKESERNSEKRHVAFTSNQAAATGSSHTFAKCSLACPVILCF